MNRKLGQRYSHIIICSLILGFTLLSGLNIDSLNLNEENSNFQTNLVEIEVSNDGSIPPNLIAIFVETSEIKNKALNTSVLGFVAEWERLFHIELPIINATLGELEGGLNPTEIDLLNGSLLIGSVRSIIGYYWTIPAEANRTILCSWNNDTYGSGWAIYGGSIDATIKSVAFYSLTLSPNKPWEYTSLIPRFSFLIGSASWGMDVASFESLMKNLVRRCFTAVQMFVQFEKLCNITLPGYSEPNHDVDYETNIELLKTYLLLGAEYGIQIYLYTDELVLTETQYDWLGANLDYTGPADDEEFPDHLSGEAPGLWTFLVEKYRAMAESIESILTEDNKKGWGGYYFRIDDLSNPYPHKYSVVKQLSYLQRFINITTSSIAPINGTVIQRMWLLGNEENTFNNATLAKQLLDPINATNLILRCKETWNDHWYNHPPNPVIGVSHHPWIIGFYYGAAMPDYKGVHLDNYFNEAGWLDNPNVIGLDSPPFQYASFQRLDSSPFESANCHYMYMKSWYGYSITARGTLRHYFSQVGLNDTAVINQLVDLFVLCHDAFRQLSFFMAWSTTGKFRGDVLNNGNSVLFEPGRFNMFYDTMQTSGYTNEYTIQEGYKGRDIAIQVYNDFPTSYNGVLLPTVEQIGKDPQYATDLTNMTQMLLTLRGNLRQFADFSRFFAPYRAWHMTFYEWGNTLNPISWYRSEMYRTESMNAYNEYQEIWSDTSYWYEANFNEIQDYWLNVVGRMDQLRLNIGIFMVIWVIGIFVFIYINKERSTKRTVTNAEVSIKPLSSIIIGLKLYTKLTKKHVESSIQVESGFEKVKTLLSVFGIPAITLITYWGFLTNMVNNLYPELVLLIIEMIASLIIATRLSLILIPQSRPISMEKQLKNCSVGGLGFFGHILTLGLLGIILLLGGIYALIASKSLLILLVLCILVSIIWNQTIIARNMVKSSISLRILFVMLCFFLTLVVFCILTLPAGGPVSAFETALEGIS